MRRRVEYVEGIGSAYGARLRRAGITTTQRLLEVCAEPERRRQLATACGIDEARLVRWVRMADLMRIRGIGRQYAELLEAAGIGDVGALAGCDVDQVLAAIRTCHGRRRPRRAPPSRTVLERWIAQARTLPVVLKQG